MKTLPLSEAKAQLSKLVAGIEKNSQEIIITKNGKPAAVLVSPDDFESYRETCEILANPELMRDIIKGIKDIKAGKAKTMTLDELFGDE